MPDLRNSASVAAIVSVIKHSGQFATVSKPSILSYLPAGFSSTVVEVRAKYGMSEWPAQVYRALATGQNRPGHFGHSGARVD